jgi:tol-pal system protein YbgF
MRLLGAALLVSLLSACAVSPEEDPVQIKLTDIDGRVQRIERVVSNQSLLDMAQKLDAAQADVRSLRGRIEELENSNEALRKQQRELYADLDKRLAAANAGGGFSGGGAGSSGSPTPGASGGSAAGAGGSASSEQAAYTTAFDALKASNYAGAISGFNSFLSTYPSSPIAENAQYWLGEAYYATGKYDQAAQSFRTVGERWPNSRKSPDALLKLGFSQLEMKRSADARVSLGDVIRKYPDSDAAKLAAERLRRIPADAR